MITIREERREDEAAIRAVNDAAFGQATEGAIVDALRANCDQLVSLVATDGDAVIGHILFSPVELRSDNAGATEASSNAICGMGLAPMSVLPAYQRKSIGSMLVRDGLARVRAMGMPYIVVLGHPEYYPRFGFERASAFEIRCPWDVPDEAFMLRAFDASVLPSAGGTAYYRAEFDAAV